MEIKNLPKREKVKVESPIEAIMLREFHMLDLYPSPQYQIGEYRVDFAFPEKLLIIECDGRQWHSSPEQIENDKRRQKKLEKLGWKVFRITGSEIWRWADEIAQLLAGKHKREKIKTKPLLDIEDIESGEEREIIEEQNYQIAQENEETIYQRENINKPIRIGEIIGSRS